MRDRSRATDRREPCQAGNRAALSGIVCVPRPTGFEPSIRVTGHGRLRGSGVQPWESPLFFICYFQAWFLAKGVDAMSHQALYRKWRPHALLMTWWARNTLPPLLGSQVEARHGFPMPTCSPAPAARARRPAPKFLARAANCLHPVGRQSRATSARNCRAVLVGFRRGCDGDRRRLQQRRGQHPRAARRGRIYAPVSAERCAPISSTKCTCFPPAPSTPC